MNAGDLARLEVAKRAFRAVEPSAAEVQRGVRKARLSLRRPRQRRAWFSKTLVAVVLAMGGLAYAKPQALGEWVESALGSAARTTPKRGGLGAGAEATLSPRIVTSSVAPAGAGTEKQITSAEAAPAQATGLAAEQPTKPAGVYGRKSNVAAARDQGSIKGAPAPVAAMKLEPEAARASVVASNAQPESSRAGLTSDWGRVGEALAGGDETRALAALKALSNSDDPRTRDKADLGRAQLLMGNGHRDQACTMARSLANRRAGVRIERQAQALLKSCTPNNR